MFWSVETIAHSLSGLERAMILQFDIGVDLVEVYKFHNFF